MPGASIPQKGLALKTRQQFSPKVRSQGKDLHQMQVIFYVKNFLSGSFRSLRGRNIRREKVTK
jgi:hypothetical protein